MQIEAVQRLSREIELHANKRRNLRRRCFKFSTQLSEAKARIAELESVLSAMKYAVKYTIDLERCALCATEEEEEEHLNFRALFTDA